MFSRVCASARPANRYFLPGFRAGRTLCFAKTPAKHNHRFYWYAPHEAAAFGVLTGNHPGARLAAVSTRGQAVRFRGCDVLTREDIANLWRLRNDRYAVTAVKHDRAPEKRSSSRRAAFPEYADCEWSVEWRAEPTPCWRVTRATNRLRRQALLWSGAAAKAAPDDPGFR